MRYLLLVTTLVTIGFTAWASAPMFGYPLGGYSQAQISAMFPTFLTPAGVTFSIWGVIYLLWFATGIMVARGSYGSHISKNQILLLSGSIALTMLWLVAWGWQYITIAGIIIVCIALWLTRLFFLSHKSPRLFRTTLEVFLAWIMVASVINITIVLQNTGLLTSGLHQMIFSIVALGVMTAIMLAYQLQYRTYAMSAVFLWAVLGIWIAHDIDLLRITIEAYVGIFIGFSTYVFFKKD